MFVSRPAVHPVEAPPLREADNDAPRVRMKDIQGMAGTPGGLALRLFQFFSALVSLCVMVTISDFSSVTAFCYLVVAVSLQSLWSLSLAIMDVYALLVRRSLRNSGIISLFTVGDGERHSFYELRGKNWVKIEEKYHVLKRESAVQNLKIVRIWWEAIFVGAIFG